MFYHGSRSSGFRHAQLRTQDSNHYLLQCPLFYQARTMMLNEIRELTITDISCELLLYGSAELGITISQKKKKKK